MSPLARLAQFARPMPLLLRFTFERPARAPQEARPQAQSTPRRTEYLPYMGLLVQHG